MTYNCLRCASLAPVGVLRVIRPDAGKERRAFFDCGGACDASKVPVRELSAFFKPVIRHYCYRGAQAAGAEAPGASGNTK